MQYVYIEMVHMVFVSFKVVMRIDVSIQISTYLEPKIAVLTLR